MIFLNDWYGFCDIHEVLTELNSRIIWVKLVLTHK